MKFMLPKFLGDRKRTTANITTNIFIIISITIHIINTNDIQQFNCCKKESDAGRRTTTNPAKQTDHTAKT